MVQTDEPELAIEAIDGENAVTAEIKEEVIQSQLSDLWKSEKKIVVGTKSADQWCG